MAAKKKFDFKKIGMKVAGVGAGAVAGKFVDKIGFIGNLNPKLRGGLKIALGAALPELMPKNEMIEHVGSGLIAVGASDLAADFGLAGIGEVGSVDETAIGDDGYFSTTDDINGIGSDDFETADDEQAIGEIGEDDEY